MVRGNILDGRVETQGRLGRARTGGTEARGAEMPETEVAMERRKTHRYIVRRGTRLSELMGSVKTSLMGQRSRTQSRARDPSSRC